MITKKIIIILLVLSLIAQAVPNFTFVAHAAVGDNATSFISCTAGGFISNKIRSGLVALEDWVTSKLGGWLKKKVTGGVNQKVPVTDDGVEGAVNNFKSTYGAKEGSLDIIARCSAREILSAMGKNITNTARTSGREGGVAWVRNWRNFQLDAQHRGEDVFRAILSNTKLCNYIDDDIKGFFGVSSKISLPANTQTRTGNLDPYQLRANCTMPSNFNIANYQRDFAGNGGWDAWSRMLEPQNNYYGALLLSLDEVAKQRAIEETADTNEAAPSGFTSVRGRDATASCAVKSKNGRCLIYKDILTPAGVLSGAVVSGIDVELQWVASSDELNEVIASGINIILNRLIDLSNSDEGDYIVPEDPEVSFSPFPTPTNDVCPVPTTSDTLCASVDQNTVLGILNNYPPSDAGITEAILEVQGIYPAAYVIPHNTGTMVLDKIDFGGGMIVDVIIGAGGANPSWGWIVECQCGG